MKIISITYHDGINYGAYWQAYCLHKVLGKISSKQAYILDYKNLRHWLMEYLVFFHKLHKPLILLQNYKKVRSFRKEQQKFRLTKNSSCDVAVYGSDEVWNFKNPLFGLDPVYFGHNILAKKRISYAASFGSVTPQDKFPSEVIDGLNTFSTILVRDHNSQQIIKKHLDRHAEIVLDPTFLLDVESTAPKVNEKKYIAVYATTLTPEQIAEVKQFATQNKLQTIALGYTQEWCDKSLTTIGPTEWLGYYKNASYIVTTMFHGTIFAIKFEKPFITFVTSYRKNKINGLLRLFNLEERIWSSGKLSKILETKVHYSSVNKKIAREKKKSLLLLEKAIKE